MNICGAHLHSYFYNWMIQQLLVGNQTVRYSSFLDKALTYDIIIIGTGLFIASRYKSVLRQYENRVISLIQQVRRWSRVVGQTDRATVTNQKSNFIKNLRKSLRHWSEHFRVELNRWLLPTISMDDFIRPSVELNIPSRAWRGRRPRSLTDKHQNNYWSTRVDRSWPIN